MSSREEEKRPLHIVGIGASAGGLEALEAFFENMTPTEELAFVVVQHLSPDYKSLMGELLTRHTAMEIHQAEDGTEIRPGSIYLIPRKKNMTCYKGRLFLTDQEQGLNLPIDIFFRSLADDQGELAVAVVLSGTGSDGTRGIRAIKEAGGMVMVQSEESAKFDGMPRSAISTGIVDFVLPPQRMPEELVRYLTGSVRILDSEEGDPDSERTSLSKIFMLIKRRTGIDLSHYKENTIVRRVERRMGINQIDTLRGYVTFLESSPDEVTTLFKEILIGVTKFFRDPEAYEVVKRQVFPAIAEGKEPGEAIRVWVAGCSTGEEAYSLAILLAEYAEESGLTSEIKVFATDIDRDALEHGSFGIYPESIAADASPERLARYFVKKGESYQISQGIREMVVFAYHNVFKDPPFRKIDLISCRNLLIYLQPTLQQQVLNNFQFSLTDRGFLFLGSSETVGEQSRYYTTVEGKWKILRFKGEHSRRETTFSAPDLSWKRRREQGEAESNPLEAAVHGGRGEEKESLEPVYERLISRYMPPSVLVDRNRQVIHLFGKLEPFLRLQAGRVDLNVLKMVHPDMAIPLGAALERALKEQQDVALDPICLEAHGREEPVELRVVPLRNRKKEQYFGIIFSPGLPVAGERGEVRHIDIDESVRQRVEDLETELQSTRESLQATIEELETANEELQATNEELLSSNEELQSTNEELQSVNEELITVNAEYQKKIEELSQLNADMDNLLAATDIGTIFLDNGMRIRKFTPPVARQVNIISRDLGRPITDLSHRLDYDELIEDIAEVTAGGRTKEVEIRGREGEWLLVKIMPYASEQGGNEGSVVSIIDISRRKRAELAQVREHDLLMRILDGSPAAITMVDSTGRITYANQRGEEILGLRRGELDSFAYNDERFRIEDLTGEAIPDEELPFRRILATGEPIHGYFHRIRTTDRLVTLRIQGNPVYGEEGEIEGAVFSLDEVDEVAQAEGCGDGENRPDSSG
ncbi:MAG: chemotaxis protein CheB [Alkalispirochaetaceae bacterium]